MDATVQRAISKMDLFNEFEGGCHATGQRVFSNANPSEKRGYPLEIMDATLQRADFRSLPFPNVWD